MTFHIGTPHRHNAGYMVNNQADPRTKQEADIQSCPHCQSLIDMQKWRKAAVQDFCTKCMKPTCNHAECQVCVPFLKKLDQFMEAQMRFQKFPALAGSATPVPQSVSIFTG